MYKIIGIDISLVSTGVTILTEKNSESLTIKSKPDKEKTPTSELLRLLTIINQIKEHIINKDINLVVIEGIAFGIQRSNSLSQLSALNYFVRKSCYSNEIPFLIVPPTTLKRFITSRGNAKKEEMLLETYKRYGKTFKGNDECDSFGLAMIGKSLLNKDEKLTKIQQEVVALLKKQLIN